MDPLLLDSPERAYRQGYSEGLLRPIPTNTSPTWSDYGNFALLGASSSSGALSAAGRYISGLRGDDLAAEYHRLVEEGNQLGQQQITSRISPVAQQRWRAEMTDSDFWDHPLSAAALKIVSGTIPSIISLLIAALLLERRKGLPHAIVAFVISQACTLALMGLLSPLPEILGGIVLFTAVVVSVSIGMWYLLPFVKSEDFRAWLRRNDKKVKYAGVGAAAAIAIYCFYSADQQNDQARYRCTFRYSDNRSRCDALAKTNMFIVFLNIFGTSIKPNEFLR